MKNSSSTNAGRGSEDAPLVAGFHLIWTPYGWWLPNDPRGSSSHEIRVERIAELGELHQGRKPDRILSAELRAFYEKAAATLQHELLTFTESDISLIAQGLRCAVTNQRYTCYACAIMPDHIHMLIRKHKHHGETMIEHLQEASREALLGAGRRRLDHPVWGGPGWKRFLYTQDDVRRVIRYIEDNPRKAGLRTQRWDFVKAYDGWLPGRWGGKR
jgi:REP element-mobilizing transposase RayT